MTTSCSYDTTSLFSLRPQAIRPLLHRCDSAKQLNLWVPTAQQNERGHTQPFPFDHYIHGIGTIVTTPNHINEIFADMSSWDTPPHEPSSVEQNMAPAITDAAEAVAVAASEPTNGVTEGAPALTDAALSTTGEVRKSSLADLANGDRDAVVAHLAKGLGPHKLLSRSSTTSQSDTEPNTTALTTNGHVPGTEVSEPDGAASIVDESTSIASTNAVATKDESTQTAPDTDASKLFRATPASSVTQSPDLSPRSVRKPGPHHRLKALTLAQDIPLPQSPAPVIAKSSTSDEGPAIPVAPAIELEPVIIQDTPPAPPVTIDGSESDTSCVIITEFPNSLSDKNLDPKAEAWIPDDAVNPLPPSRPESPVNIIHKSKTDYINECCPVPSEWSVPTEIGSLAEDHLFDFDSPTVGGVHKTALVHYSHYFAVAFTSQDPKKEVELKHVVEDPSFAVFRQWVFRQKLYLKSSTGAIHQDMNIDLKHLVQLWRFGARIQAPLFANVVANAMLKKVITSDDIVDAADDIDALLKVISVNNTFRLLISHMVILRGIQLGQAQYDEWPKTLIWSILNCLEMGRKTYPVIQLYSQTHPCIYHLHSLGRTCMSE
ncbi:hypothetical protein KCU99_g2960, partial [Aureobasidium melanogenum]